MENEENQKLDIFVLLEDFLRQARRMWMLCILLMLLFSTALTVMKQMSYMPVYEAYASFTIRVTSPLYASVSSYNEKTAEVMANTFPSILTSNLLQEKVKEELGIAVIPYNSISATSQSTILTLTVRDSDPQRAYDVLNAVIKCYPEVSEFVVGATDMVLLDESGVPTEPTVPFESKEHAIKGAFVGAFIWFGIVVIFIMLKNTIHNEEELRKTLNIPCFSKIPAVKLPKKMLAPLVHRYKADSGFDESVRLLRLRVEKAMNEENKKVLLVSSAIPGEGKTTVAINIAASMAQKGNKVLLIDCDLRNPSVVKVLATRTRPLSNQNSLVDYLKGNVMIRDMIQPTELMNMFIISGGLGIKDNNPVMLSRDRMLRLIQAARKLYDYVILDTPPSSLLSDAAEIAEWSDAGLMVIRQDFAPRDRIVDGVQCLSECGLPIIGCALNHAHKGFSYDYGYGYGYGYGKKKK